MSFKPVRRKREQKTTHFEYTVDMQPLTSPHPPHKDRARTALTIPSVVPGQAPVQRRLPGDARLQHNQEEEEESELQISAEAVRKLQEIIEAQKGFLKYHEMREILQSKPSSNSEVKLKASRTRETYKKGRKLSEDNSEVSEVSDTASKSVSLKLQSDSDKENSLSVKDTVSLSCGGSKKVRKVGKVAKSVFNEDVEASKKELKHKRKSDSPISELDDDKQNPEKSSKLAHSNSSAKSSLVRPALVSTSVQTSLAEEGAAGGASASLQTGPGTEKTEIKCDWAYWYVPDTNTLQPARVTIRSSRRGPGPVEQGCRHKQGGSKKRSNSRGIEQVRDRSKSKDVLILDDKPWRKGMKKVSDKEPPVVEANIADKPLLEKAWRSNMRSEPKKVELPKEDPKPNPLERAWRTNMRKEQTQKEPNVPPPKKRHYDRKEVRDYMKSKRVKEKEEQEEREKEEALRKEIIKRRLNELDKIQKQITEADLQEYRRMGQAEKHLSEKGQELLRQKLMELTEQMKSQWKERQSRNQENDSSQVSSDEVRLESVYQKSERKAVSDDNNVNIVPDYIDSSRKVKNKQSLKLNNKELERNSLAETIPFRPETLSLSEIPFRTGTLSISEVSDATEIKSLSENPTRTDRMSRRRSKLWKEKLSTGEQEMTNNVLRVDNTTTEAGRSANATPLTDEVPERDLSDEGPESKSQQLRKIVGEVFSRHQSDLDFIRNTMKDIEIPEDSMIPPNLSCSPTKFVPRFPIVITTPPSLPDLDLQPRPVPQPRTSRFVSGDSQETLESDKPPVWMNVTKNCSETEFGDLLDGLPENTQEIQSKIFSIPANLSTTTYAQPPQYLASSNISSSQISNQSLNNLSATNYADPPLASKHPEPLARNLSTKQVLKRVPKAQPIDNLSATIYAELPPANLSNTNYAQVKSVGAHQVKASDQFNFMNTVLRKYELATSASNVTPEMDISEGVLTPSPTSSHTDSSIASSYAGVIDSKTYSKKQPELVQKSTSDRRRRKVSSMRTSSDRLTADTDSESTLKGIDDSIMQNSPRLQEDLLNMQKNLEKQQRKQERKLKKSSHSESNSRSVDCSKGRVPVPAATSVVSKDIQVSESIQFAPSTVPDALHLRFLTELNQLETVNSTQRLLDELDQIKKSAFDNNRGLEEVQNEMTRQRMVIEEQNNTEKLRAAQKELQDLYSSKLQMLLDSQNEVTKVTSDVAKHLATIASGNNLTQEPAAFSVVTELQKMIENLQTKQKQVTPTPTSSRATTQTSSQSATLSETVSQSRTVRSSKTATATAQTSYSRQESERDSIDGVIPSEIVIDPSTYSSKPRSSILDLIDQNQAAGSSIQKTISEALASISESDQKTRSNITAEVEEELSTDYSSQFEDESTLKEKSFQAVLPSVYHRRKSMKLVHKKKLSRDFSSDASESSLVVSDREIIELETSSNSLFSDNQSFSKFTLEMVTQYMEEETVRAHHKNSLLKIKEKALIDKAKKQVEDLDKIKQEYVDKGQDDKMPKIKKKKRTILHKLKERRAEISQMRDNLKIAERERQFLLQEQRNLLKAEPRRKDTDDKDTKVLGGDSADQESDAPEHEKIARIEVLKGLKKLDKNKKYQTSKERKLNEKKNLSSSKLFDTSKVDESGSDFNADESGQNISRLPSSALECETEPSSKSVSASIKTVLSETKTSTIKSALSYSDHDRTSENVQSQVPSSRTSTVKTAATSISRHRHSSAESENDSIVHSLADTTMSDQSDIEARIAALSDKLQNRMRTAAKLKKEQKKERKDKLRTQEVTLKKQIEKYDQLINEGFADIASEKSEPSDSYSKPKIKSPKSSISERMSPMYKEDRVGRSSPRSAIVTPEVPSYSVSFVEEDFKQDSDSSHKTISFDGSTSTIIASPKKGVSPSPQAEHPGLQTQSPSLHSVSEAIDSVSEAIEEAISLPSSSRSVTPVAQQKSVSMVESKYSTTFEQQSPEKSKQTITAEKSKSINTSEHQSAEKSEYFLTSFEKHSEEKREQNVFDLSKKTSSTSNEKDVSQEKPREKVYHLSSESSKISEEISVASKESEPSAHLSNHESISLSKKLSKETASKSKYQDEQEHLPPKRISENLVDSVTDHIWRQLLNETKSQLSTCINQSFEIQARSPKKHEHFSDHYRTSLVSPRSKPQDLMMTTFDLTSSSEESPSPHKKHPDDKEDLESDDQEFRLDIDQDFIDDDFGLSAIRQEAEILRLQQIKVEEEIAAIQKGEDIGLGILRTIPDKPPPPYIPPTPAKPEKPAPPKVVVPTTKEDVSKLLAKFVKVLHEARENFMDITQVEFTENFVDLSEDLTDKEKESVVKYHKMLYAVTVEKIVDIYRCEKQEQNPPWMQPLPLAKLRFLTPKSVSALTERVQKEVCSDLRLMSRVTRESLLVRWAGKKRDRVDEILVRELQEEEAVWTDYTLDEVVVKDQMTDTILDSLVQDTAIVFSNIYSKMATRKSS